LLTEGLIALVGTVDMNENKAFAMNQCEVPLKVFKQGVAFLPDRILFFLL